ncbi:glycosyltransferase family 39 protein, partial [Deltaproteobacteria bacterium]|nr:glycosyltransferase family 39 protein [Deltaproteobacteria bacterium]
MTRSVALERLVFAVVPLLTVWGIWSYGLWDPWELDLAGAARFGRVPGVLAGCLTCLLAFLLLRRYFGARTGVIAIAVIASTPLFLLNARLLMGNAVAVFAQTWVGLAAVTASSGPHSSRRALSHYLTLGFGVVASTLASGVLLGPLPPIAAVAAWSVLSEDSGEGSRVSRWLLPIAAAILVLGVARAVSLDDPGFSVWLGGGSLGGNPPTFDKAAELIFHGFAPWSAALPVAVIWTLIPRPERSAESQDLVWVLLLWAAFAFVSWTVFASRYGTPPYLALVPMAGLVAIWMAEVSDERVAQWPAAVVVALLVGLLIRDYALYPDSPLRSLAVDGLNVPDVYDPKGQWALLFSCAGALLCLMLVSHEAIERPQPQRTVRWLRSQWEAGGAPRGWILLCLSLLAISVSFGLMCFVLDLRVASIVVRAGRVAFFIPFVLAALVLGLPWVRYAYGRLGNLRAFPALGGGLAVGAFVALSFQPALSQHFSPKPVYDAFG